MSGQEEELALVHNLVEPDTRHTKVTGTGKAVSLSHVSTFDEVAQMRAALTNPACFEPIYRAYFPRIYAYCWHRVSSPQEAEDLASLVFTRALAALDGFRGGSVAGWLFCIARNAIANYHRDRRRLVPLQIHIADRAATPSERFEHQENQQFVHRLLATLPDNDRELLLLKVVAGLRAEDIGVSLGISTGAVRVRLHRILQRLRKRANEELAE